MDVAILADCLVEDVIIPASGLSSFFFSAVAAHLETMAVDAAIMVATAVLSLFFSYSSVETASAADATNQLL